MKTKKLLKYFFIAAIIGVFFASCKKKDTATTVDSDTSGASDNALAEGTFSDVSHISDQAAGGVLTSYLSTYNTSSNRGILSSCATITVDSAHHKFTINFGTTPCLCHDGRYRSGVITVTYSGTHYYDVNGTITIAFASYSVNGNLTNGAYSIVNNGNVNGIPTYTIDVNGTILKANSGGTITWVSHRVRSWTAGSATPTDFTDDVYSITGTASGTHSNGETFTETCSNLMVHLNCSYIESGQLNITPAGKATRYIDFGPDGTCDSKATVTINGISYSFTM